MACDTYNTAQFAISLLKWKVRSHIHFRCFFTMVLSLVQHPYVHHRQATWHLNVACHIFEWLAFWGSLGSKLRNQSIDFISNSLKRWWPIEHSYKIGVHIINNIAHVIHYILDNAHTKKSPWRGDFKWIALVWKLSSPCQVHDDFRGKVLRANERPF